MFFISPKKLFSFARCSNFCIPVFPSFFSMSGIAIAVEDDFFMEKSSGIFALKFFPDQLFITYSLLFIPRNFIFAFEPSPF